MRQILFVDFSIGTPYQIWMPDMESKFAYKRTCSSNTWNNWNQLWFTDTNTWRPLGTTADTACAGNDSRLSNARPANGGNASTVNGHTVNADVPENAKFTDTTYSVATTSAAGLMSVYDKTNLMYTVQH